MPRTRGQEVKLIEKGIPPTPPQQLSTPRRITKAKTRIRKTVVVDNAPPATSQPAPSRARGARARTTSASQSDQPTLAPQPPTKKRGRNTKASKSTSRIAEETMNGVQPALDALQESTEEDHSVDQQATSRETLSYNPSAPVSCSSFVHSPTSPAIANARGNAGHSLPKNAEPSAEADQGPFAGLVSKTFPTFEKSALVKTDSEWSTCLPPAAPSVSPEDRLKLIMLEYLPVFLAILRTHPEITGNAIIAHLLTNGEISVSVKPSNRKPKARVALQTMEQSPQNGHYAPELESAAAQVKTQPTTKRKALQIEHVDPENPSPKRPRLSVEQPKRVPVLFDQRGMLSLRAYKEVPASGRDSSDAESTNTSVSPLDGAFFQGQRQASPSPETPRPRGWALSNFLPSAQTVTRFLPSFSIRTPAVAPASHTPDLDLQDHPTTPTPSAAHRLQSEVSPVTPLQIQQGDRASQSEPRPVIGSEERGRRAEAQPAATARASHRHRGRKSKHGLKTKGEREEIRKRDEMIASLRAQLEAQKDMHLQKEEQAEKAAQAQREISAQVEAEAQKTVQHNPGDTSKHGTKRKAESPKVIPNPPGGGFGMVLEYFGQESDDDDDDDGDTNMGGANIQATPTKPPSKKPRLSGGPPPQIVGDPLRATPYTGSALALPDLPPGPVGLHGNFLDMAMDAGAEEHVPNVTPTPDNGPTMTFRVPSPGDSDDEWDGPSYVEPSPDPPALGSSRIPGLFADDAQVKSSSTTTTRKQASPVNATPKQPLSLFSKIPEPSGSTASPSQVTSQGQSEPLFPSRWTAPSSRPALEPSKAPAVPNVALDKARQTALKHKPQQPSRLRESSRLSTSTVGTEVDDEETANKTGQNQAPKPNKASLEDPETRDPYAGRLMRQSQHDPMLLEPVSMPGESSPPINDSENVDGNYSSDNANSDQDLPENFPRFASYEEYEKTISPRVKEFLATQWSSENAHFHRDASSLVIQQFSEYEKQTSNLVEIPQQENVSEKVQNFIESTWDQTDNEAAIEKFDLDFETWLEQPI